MFWKAADGRGAVEPLLTGEDAPSPRVTPNDWSPDGNELIINYAGPDRSFDIGVLSIAGERSWRPLLNSAAGEFSPALSPDGAWIAYQSDETGQLELYVERYPDLGNRELISTGGGRDPVWSSDGSELFYLSLDRSRMMVVPVETEPSLTLGTSTVVFEATYYDSFGRGYDLAPNGRFLMVKPPDAAAEEGAPASSQIVVVQNWFEELTRFVPVD